jgi:hypothetical protein
MSRRFHNSEDEPLLPPRIKAAFDYLDHVRSVTEQMDVSIPARELSPLEKKVELAALHALQQYLLGEIDFAEQPSPAPPPHRDVGDEGSSPVPANTP